MTEGSGAPRFQLVARTGHPSFLDLPWHEPLEEWQTERRVDLVRGRSRHVGRFVQYAGHHADADRTVWRGDPADAAWSVCWLRGSRLVALLAVGRPRDLAQGRRLIEAGTEMDAEALADPARPLKSATA